MGISNARQFIPTKNLFESALNDYTDDAAVNSDFLDARDFRNVVIQLIAKDSYDGKLEFFGSLDDDAPSFAAASSAGNAYFPIEMKYRNNDTSVVGTTGLTYDGSADGTRCYAPNTNEIKWFGIKISGRTAGSICVQATTCNNA
jgi:hypothetical protein